MSLTYRLVSGTLVFTTTGGVDFEEGLKTLQAGFQEIKMVFPPQNFHLLFDLQHSTENRSASELQNISVMVAAARTTLSMRCALVAADPLHFGLARMFGAFMESQGFTVNVCKKMDEAQRWLEQVAPIQ